MMNLEDETRRILRSHGIVPRKRLGQSFLVDRVSLQRIVSYASLNKKDTVLEIGAGLGSLTEHLAEKAGKVIAIEVDPRLMQILREMMRNRVNVALIEGDVLKLSIQGFEKVVSTPPYSISSPILFWLLETKYELAVLSFQEEFAKRLAAQVGSSEYGRLTVTTYYHSEVELLDIIESGYHIGSADIIAYEGNERILLIDCDIGSVDPKKVQKLAELKKHFREKLKDYEKLPIVPILFSPKDFRQTSSSIDVMIADESVIKRIFEAVVQGNRKRARSILYYSGF